MSGCFPHLLGLILSAWTLYSSRGCSSSCSDPCPQAGSLHMYMCTCPPRPARYLTPDLRLRHPRPGHHFAEMPLSPPSNIPPLPAQRTTLQTRLTASRLNCSGREEKGGGNKSVFIFICISHYETQGSQDFLVSKTRMPVWLHGQ